MNAFPLLQRQFMNYMKRVTANPSGINGRKSSGKSQKQAHVDAVTVANGEKATSQQHSIATNSEKIEQAKSVLISEGYTDHEISTVLSRINDPNQIRDPLKYLQKALDLERSKPPTSRTSKTVPAQQYHQRDYSGEDEAALQRMMALFEEEENSE